jgi:hypothetical protein
MPKSAVLLTDLQIVHLIELFDSDSINNKTIEIPLRFNSKFNTKYTYYRLYVHYLKVGSNKNSRVNINSLQNRNKTINPDKMTIINGKRKLKNDVVVNKDQISKKQKLIDILENNELDINVHKFFNRMFVENNIVVNYKENIDYFINKFHLRRLIVRGDGLCFINCLVLYHEHCLNNILTMEMLKNIYHNYFVTHPILTFNSDDYHNELLLNLNDYFENKNYNSEICHYIINVTPEVFKLSMFILNLENDYIISINKMTHESIDLNDTIYLVRDSFTNCQGINY